MPVRLACPECDAVYEVPDDAVPAEGREVECGACGRRWHQDGAAADAPADGAPGGADPVAGRGGGAAVPDPAGGRDAGGRLRQDGTDAQDESGLPRPPPVRDPEDLRILREEAERESRLRRGQPAGDGDDGSNGAADGAAPGGDPVAPGDARPEAGAGDAAGPEAAMASGLPVDRIVPKRPTRSGAPSTPRPRPREDVTATGGRVAGRPAEREAAAPPRPRPSAPGAPPPPAAEPARRGGFGRGFLGVVALAAILAGLYVYAGDIARAVPAAAPAAEAYADTVDAARAAAEDAVRRATAALGDGT